MATIQVQKIAEDDGGFAFEARVGEGTRTTTHRVTMSRDDYDEIGARASSPEEFIETCLRTMLEQMSQEDLMTRMDLREMIQYYPGFEQRARWSMGDRKGHTSA